MNTKKGQFEPARVRKLNEKQFRLCFFLGFSIFNSAVKSFKAEGKNGRVLQEEWEKAEQGKAYLGITCVSPVVKKLPKPDFLWSKVK
jgi:hypothetical protein